MRLSVRLNTVGIFVALRSVGTDTGAVVAANVLVPDKTRHTRAAAERSVRILAYRVFHAPAVVVQAFVDIVAHLVTKKV